MELQVRSDKMRVWETSDLAFKRLILVSHASIGTVLNSSARLSVDFRNGS